MPLTRHAQQGREADTIRSHPNRAGFFCPDIAALDGHLKRLAEQRKAPTLTEAGRRRFTEDIDALLDARVGMVAMERGLDIS